MKNFDDQKRESMRIEQIRKACGMLGIPMKLVNTKACIIELPPELEFKRRLPPDKDCSPKCEMLQNTKETLKKLVGGDAELPWTFYRVHGVIGIEWSLDPPPKTSNRKGEDDFALNGHKTTGRDQPTAIAGSEGRKRAKGRR